MNRRETGIAGEEAATAHLRAKGYKILARNWRKGSFELDIVCKSGDTIVFVEVRTRAATGKVTPGETLTPAKCRSFLRAVRAWLAETDSWSRPCRCDLASVTCAGEPPTFSVEHVPHVIEYSAESALGSGNATWQPW